MGLAIVAVVCVVGLLSYAFLHLSKEHSTDVDAEERKNVDKESVKEMKDHLRDFTEEVDKEEQPDGSQWEENTFTK